MSSKAAFKHLYNQRRNRNSGIADRSRNNKHNSIDLYIGNIPKQFNYEAMVNVIYTTYEYYREEGKEIFEIPKLQAGDVVRITELKISNEKFWEQHKKGFHNQTSSSESESSSDNDQKSTDLDLSEDEYDSRNYKQERKPPSKTVSWV